MQHVQFCKSLANLFINQSTIPKHEFKYIKQIYTYLNFTEWRFPITELFPRRGMCHSEGITLSKDTTIKSSSCSVLN